MGFEPCFFFLVGRFWSFLFIFEERWGTKGGKVDGNTFLDLLYRGGQMNFGRFRSISILDLRNFC